MDLIQILLYLTTVVEGSALYWKTNSYSLFLKCFSSILVSYFHQVSRIKATGGWSKLMQQVLAIIPVSQAAQQHYSLYAHCLLNAPFFQTPHLQFGLQTFGLILSSSSPRWANPRWHCQGGFCTCMLVQGCMHPFEWVRMWSGSRCVCVLCLCNRSLLNQRSGRAPEI